MKLAYKGLMAAVLTGALLLATGVGSAVAPGRPLPQSQTTSDIRELALAASLAGEIESGQVHVYRITLAAHQFLRLSIIQQDVDVAVRLMGPDGRLLAEVDRTSAASARERISLVTDAAGDYRLEVRALKKDARGRYEASIEELRAATAEDTSRVAAERYFDEAEQLRRQREAGSPQASLAKYQEALSLFRALNDRHGQAMSLIGIGKIHIRLGEDQKALEPLTEALPHAQSSNDRDAESAILMSLGTVHQSLGDPHKALEYNDRALRLVRDRGDLVNEILTLVAIGLTHWEMGEYQKSVEYYYSALALIRANEHREPKDSVASRYTISVTLNNLGLSYAALGEYQQALQYMNQVLDRSREAKYSYGEASALHNIGWIYALSGELQKALDHLEQALTIARRIGDQALHRKILYVLGGVYNDLNQQQKALALFQKALALCRATGDSYSEADTLNEIGLVHDRLGETQKSLEHYTQALSLSRAIGHRADEAAALYGLARAHRNNANLDQARSEIDDALNIIESARTKVVSQHLRTSYLASNRPYYELFVDVLMRQHRSQPSRGLDAMALQVSERGRARSLLETLTEARANIRHGVDSTLLEREHVLQQQLNAKAERLARLAESREAAEQAAAARKELDAVLTEYQEIQALIRARSPRYAALTQPAPLSLTQIQQQLLDDDTLLLEYSLGKERSFLWAIARTSIASFELPGQDEIESAARRAYEILIVSHRRQQKRESELALAELSQMVLGPVEQHLTKKRLLIVADGALHYVPFAALRVSRASETHKPGDAPTHSVDLVPLIADHEIINVPSASVLAVLRREMNDRRPAVKTVAMLADPVLRPDDPRVKPSAKEARGATSVSAEAVTIARDLVRSARETGILNVERLPSTRIEAEAILALAQKGTNLKALDFDASRATATSPQLADYRFVHFATHGLINSRHPELSGIVLSLVDRQGRPQDGFLRAHEVYNLKLGAELVVLSGCQTALGKEVRGEGLLGLVRAFMYAGSPRVVASLWDVRDDVTAELMKRFYQKMLVEGLPPGAALRQAQLSMWKDERWQAPYYWAAFVLQGEWK